MATLDDNQFLTFGIDGEVYAIPVSKVQEVLEYIKPVRLPKTAPYLKGLINIRGTGIPVVDLRMRFEMPELEASSDTAIIVVEISRNNGGMLVIGALTDQVHEVIQIDPGQQEPAPRFGSKIDVNFIKCIGKKDGGFIIILDVDRIFNDDESADIAEVPVVAASS